MADKVGEWFRFITPVMVTIAIFFLGTVLKNQDSMGERIEAIAKEQSIYYNNHLSEHKDFCVTIEHRLTKIESRIGILNGDKIYGEVFGNKNEL